MTLYLPPKDQIPVAGLPVRQHIPDGDPGSFFTMQGMRNIVNDYPCKNLIKGIVQKVTANAGSDQEKIGAIFRWACAVVQYEKDPPDVELIKSPCRILREAANNGRATGDCDDSAVMIAACLKAAGIRCQFMAVSNEKLSQNFQNPPLDHVFTVAWDNQAKKWISVDPVAPGVSWVGHKFMTLEV